jgi:hypothetical protein
LYGTGRYNFSYYNRLISDNLNTIPNAKLEKSIISVKDEKPIISLRGEEVSNITKVLT